MVCGLCVITTNWVLCLNSSQHAWEAPDVGVVERGVDLVEQAERARLDQVDREQQRRSRSAPARRRTSGGCAGVRLPRGLASISISHSSGSSRIGQPELGIAAVEQRLEDVLEVVLHRREGLHEHRRAVTSIFPIACEQRVPGRHQVVPLGAQELEPLASPRRAPRRRGRSPGRSPPAPPRCGRPPLSSASRSRSSSWARSSSCSNGCCHSVSTRSTMLRRCPATSVSSTSSR